MRACTYERETFTENTDRNPTAHIWNQVPWTSIRDGTIEGTVFWDDFVNMPNLSADADLHKYAAYIDTSCTIQQGAGSEFGECEMTLTGTTDDEAWLQTGGNTGGMCNFINPATSTPNIIYFECRVKVSTLLGSFFIGFGEEGLAAADTIADAGTMADKDLFGFNLPEADPDGVDLMWDKEATAGPTVGIADLDTVVADTYMKLGFVYDYRNPSAEQIAVYLNGQRQTTFVTLTQIQAAVFPAAEEMSILWGVKNVTDIKVLTVDWIRFAQHVVS